MEYKTQQETSAGKPSTGQVSGPRYHLLVIGGGVAGLTAALGAAGLGARVALISRHGAGSRHGLSRYYFSLLRQVASGLANRSYAVQAGMLSDASATVNLPEILRRAEKLQELVKETDALPQLSSHGVEVITGEGRFGGPEWAEVGGRKLTFGRAVIAIGGRIQPPKVPGLAEVQFLTPDSLLSLHELPNRVAILGGDAQAYELAQVLARCGTRATVYDCNLAVLPNVDTEAAALLRNSLQRDGVHIRTGCAELRVDQIGRELRVIGTAHSEQFEDTFDKLLLTSDSTSDPSELNLEAARIDSEDGKMSLNDFLFTTNRHVLAAGAVCNYYYSVQAAEAMGRMVIANGLMFGRERLSSLIIPRCVRTDPEIAEVGVTGTEAQDRGLHVISLPIPEFSLSSEAVDDGLLKLCHDTHGQIRGATILSHNATEIIGELVIAIRHKVKLSTIASALHAVPSSADTIRKAGETYRRTLLTPFVSGIIRRVLQMRK